MAEKHLFSKNNEAVVEGAPRVGCLFFAGSPMAPATEISEVLSMKLSQVDGKFVQMEDGVTLGTDPQC